jgi:hypothetical protein
VHRRATEITGAATAWLDKGEPPGDAVELAKRELVGVLSTSWAEANIERLGLSLTWIGIGSAAIDLAEALDGTPDSQSRIVDARAALDEVHRRGMTDLHSIESLDCQVP